jgi:hypothetical protein
MRASPAIVTATLCGAFVAACETDSSPTDLPSVQIAASALPATPRIYATGLNDPRGLTFGPDGALYVAEAGLGGDVSTVGQCFQKPFPFGPATGGPTARISRISEAGVRATLVDGLPSSRDNPLVGATVLGVADVEFIGNTLYALIAGGGCSHGNPGTTNGIIRVNRDGTWSEVTDHSAFLRDHEVTHPDSTDIEPDGSPYSMVRQGNDFVVAEANQAQVLRESLSGTITRLADVTAQVGNITPTAIAARGSHLVIGNLGNVPFLDGSAAVRAISHDGRLSILASGLTTVLSVAYDRRGRLYALETSVGKPVAPPFLFPGTGRVVRVEDSGQLTVVAEGLTLPTAMTFGARDELFISVCGYGCGEGAGAVVRVELPD